MTNSVRYVLMASIQPANPLFDIAMCSTATWPCGVKSAEPYGMQPTADIYSNGLPYGYSPPCLSYIDLGYNYNLVNISTQQFAYKAHTMDMKTFPANIRNLAGIS